MAIAQMWLAPIVNYIRKMAIDQTSLQPPTAQTGSPNSHYWNRYKKITLEIAFAIHV
jgi:hypothetical protein